MVFLDIHFIFNQKGKEADFQGDFGEYGTDGSFRILTVNNIRLIFL